MRRVRECAPHLRGATMEWKMGGMVVLLVGALLAMAGCQTIGDVQWVKEKAPQTLPTPLQSQLMVIEIKEDGAFHDPDQFVNLKQWIDQASPTDPVVVFVHGWHHNAQPDDANLKDFTAFVAKIEAATCQKQRNIECPSIDGIYVGWRGDSVDYPIGQDVLDFWTIWGRKAISRQIGQGGLAKIIAHIRRQHPNRNVIVAGHSLGASALFYAVKDDLGELVEDNFEYIMMNPAVGSSEFEGVAEQLNQVARAEMTRVSPSAKNAEAMTILSRSHRKLLVMQALGDIPVGWLYRLAFISDIPVGFDDKLTTHQAYACRQDGGECEQRSDRPSNSDFAKAEVEAGMARDYCSIYLAKKEFVIETKRQGPEDDTCWENFSKAVWVVSGADSVSRSHGDIFNGVQERALADLISQRIAAGRP